MSSIFLYLSTIGFLLKIPLIGVGYPYAIIPLSLSSRSTFLYLISISTLAGLNTIELGGIGKINQYPLWVIGAVCAHYYLKSNRSGAFIFISILIYVLIGGLFQISSYYPEILVYVKETGEYIFPMFLDYSQRYEFRELLILNADPNTACAALAAFLLLSSRKYFIFGNFVLLILSLSAFSRYFILYSLLMFLIYTLYWTPMVPRKIKISFITLLFLTILAAVFLPQVTGTDNVRYIIWGFYLSEFTSEGVRLFSSTAVFHDEMLPGEVWSPHNTFFDMYLLGGLMGLLIFILGLIMTAKELAASHNPLFRSATIYFFSLSLIFVPLSLGFTTLVGLITYLPFLYASRILPRVTRKVGKQSRYLVRASGGSD